MNNTISQPFVNTPIAIIGIGCFFPKASGLNAYWRLLFHGTDAIGDVPASHWSVDDYFDADPGTKDKIYCSRGGFLAPIEFDPTEYGIPPNTLEATDTSQLLGLVAAKMALDDAGYGEKARSFNRDRTSVILGVTGTQELVIPLGARLDHPKWRKALKDAGVPDDKAEEVVDRLSSSYVSWQENSFPGLLGNVVAGRICNRLDLGGTNCVVDAACASSMSAIHLATLELATHRADMVLTGGVDTLNDIFMHMCFGQTGILSPSGDVRPFSKDADGTLLGEGVGILVMKRLADAEKDQDRVYAVIRGVGTSSDGRSQSIYAPRKEGQIKALRAAYEMADINPSTINLIEAHGTGTRVGDQTEFQTLNEVFTSSAETTKSAGSYCALGAVKSMIGHTKAAAGTAGLIKTALALHHKTLLPTIKADPTDPDLGVENSPFYLNITTRPWLSESDHPRRGGVSSFGFGGSNFHVVLEEHQSGKGGISWEGSIEIFALSAESIDEIVAALSDWVTDSDQESPDQAIAAMAADSRRLYDASLPHRLLLVVDLNDGNRSPFKTVIEDALGAIKANDGDKESWVSGNVYYGSGTPKGTLAFVFPGQGSQYVNMGRDLMCIFPEALEALEQFNGYFGDDKRLSDVIFPLPAQSKEELTKQETSLRSTDMAQPAIGAVSLGMVRILAYFGISAASVCGHSYGELPALFAAGWLDTDGFCRSSIARGKLMAVAGQSSDGDPGTMLAVKADLAKLDALVASLDSDVILANRNSPSQGVLSGSSVGIKAAAKKCRQSKFRAIPLPVAAAFHSHLVAAAQQPFRQLLDDIEVTPNEVAVFSNTTGNAYPADPAAARDLLGSQIVNPVDFIADIQNQYDTGVRTFVEVGPKTVLTGLIRQILKKKEHTAMALDASGGKKFGLLDLAKSLCHLSALGYSVQLDRWENPPPSGKGRKPIMRIPVGGANITNPTTVGRASTSSSRSINTDGNQSTASPDDAVTSKDHMNNQQVINPIKSIPTDTNQPTKPVPSKDEVRHSLGVIREGLKSMQEIQARTAKAHELFLETQAEAARVLHSLILQTRDTSQTAGIIDPLPPPTDKEISSDVTPPNTKKRADSSAAADAKSQRQPLSDNTLAATTSEILLESPQGEYASTSIADTLFTVIGELTGYPSEMLNHEMNIETDLGIDSIKRVEILSTMEERMPALPVVAPEDMGELKTLGHIISYLSAEAPDKITSGTSQDQDRSTDIKAILFNVIAELTGYPANMLKPDMAIEADLGIDSIKRVEILSAMEERAPELPAVAPEDMGDLKTLGQIIDYLASDTLVVGNETKLAVSVPVTDINRYVVTPVVVHSPLSIPTDLNRRGTIFVTEDGTGISAAIATSLSAHGIPSVVVSTDSSELERIQNEILGGLIAVLPNDKTTDFSTIRQIYQMIQVMGKKLSRGNTVPAPIFASITRMDGAFGFLEQKLNDPFQGALPGLVKTAALEWPNVLCRSIDVPPEWRDHAAIADKVLPVIVNADTEMPIEIGLHPDLPIDKQYQLQLYSEELPHLPLPLSGSDVVVISGGARGITAAAAVALAQQSGARLALLGRSAQPSPDPNWLTNKIDPADIKRAILANEFNDQPPLPAELEAAYQHHKANREINDTLRALSQLDAKAKYYSVDVTTAEEVSQTLDTIRDAMGPITALIHGAGILRDSLIVDKSMDALEAVFNVKVKGAQNLLAATRQDALRHLVFFTSVTARFGNSGQSDYAMANEVLNKMAHFEAANRPDCKVTAINWGPWDGGMVSSALKQVFSQRGISLIPTQLGTEFLIREMGVDPKGAVEVVIGSRLDDRETSTENKVAKTPSPLQPSDEYNLSFRREVDLQHYPILDSHRLDGYPVVPFALMTEWFGHGALHENPGLILHGIDDMRLLKGIRMKSQNSKTIRLMAGKAYRQDNQFEVPIELRDGVEDGVEVIHSRGRAILVESLEQPPPFEPPQELVAAPYFRPVDEVYDTILFHGEHLRGLKQITNLSPKGMMAEINTSPRPESWMTEPLRSNWLADPLALDTAFQMASVWCYEEKGMVSLPSYTASYRQFARRFPTDGLKVILEVREVKHNKMIGDFTFIDNEGLVVAQLKGYEAVMDPALYHSFKPQLTPSGNLNKGRSAA